MNVLLVNGSPHEQGCTDTALQEAGRMLEQAGIRTTRFWIGSEPLAGCSGCGYCAREMAEHVRRLLDVDLCVSFTGNAGPDCMEGKPAGTVYCALAAEGGCETWHFHFAHASRNAVRSRVVDEMVLRIKSYLNEGQGNE